MSKKEVDAISGTETTGHEWDGIKELNTPLPRWWLWTFYITIIWSIGYMIAYPAWPLISSNTKGLLGYSSRAEVAAELAAADEARSGIMTRIADSDLNQIASDEEMRRFAIAGGRSAFLVNCVQCHGSGAQGSPGYPNLNDDEWLWGGTLDDIYLTINHGIRFEADDDTRLSDMPAFGRDELLEQTDIADVTEYVLSLRDDEHDAAMAARGETVYVDNCAACHGENAGGDAEFGAPSLTDAIFLYGSSREDLMSQIQAPKHGVMPAWGARLGEPTIKQLTVYVHSLGGGQ